MPFFIFINYINLCIVFYPFMWICRQHSETSDVAEHVSVWIKIKNKTQKSFRRSKKNVPRRVWSSLSRTRSDGAVRYLVIHCWLLSRLITAWARENNMLFFLGYVFLIHLPIEMALKMIADEACGIILDSIEPDQDQSQRNAFFRLLSMLLLSYSMWLSLKGEYEHFVYSTLHYVSINADREREFSLSFVKKIFCEWCARYKRISNLVYNFIIIKMNCLVVRGPLCTCTCDPFEEDVPTNDV